MLSLPARLGLLWFLPICGGVHAQTATALSPLPAQPVPGFTRGTPGHPFHGIATWTTGRRDPEFGDFSSTQEPVPIFRDGAGRERLEWPSTATLYRRYPAADATTVLLLDPVAGCVYLWLQSAEGVAGPEPVKRSCEPAGTAVPARPDPYDQNGSQPDQPFGNNGEHLRLQNTVLGTETIDGIETRHLKHGRILVPRGGGVVQSYSEEDVWYAPSLDMVLRRRSETYSEYVGTRFDLRKLELGEPAAALFQPPAARPLADDPLLTLLSGEQAAGANLYAYHYRPAVAAEFPDFDRAGLTEEAARPLAPAFPAAWYAASPKAAPAGFTSGKANRPFRATGDLFVYKPDAPGAMELAETYPVEFDRDAEGRTRLTVLFPQPGRYRSSYVGAIIYVHDPVAHCIFRWFEGALRSPNPNAAVRCADPAAALPPDEPWDEPTSLEKAALPPGASLKLEPAGQKQVDGLPLLVYRDLVPTPATATAPAGTVAAGERWYSPMLGEVLHVAMRDPHALPHASAARRMPVTLDMTQFVLGPPAVAFYPPPGATIVVDPTLVPFGTEQPKPAPAAR